MKLYKLVMLIFLTTFVVIFIKIGGLDMINDKISSYSHPLRYQDIVSEYCNEYNVDEALVYAIIKNESNFYPLAKSKAGCVGLMQISKSAYDHAKEIIDIQEDDMYNKKTNVKVGVWYLSYLIDRFKDVRVAIIAYNAGPANVENWIKKGFLDTSKDYLSWNIPFAETSIYIDRVLKSKDYYEKILSKNAHTQKQY